MKLYLKIEGSRCHIKVDFHPRINSLLKSFEDHTYENNVYSYPIKYKDELISSLLALNLDVIEYKSFPEKIEQKKRLIIRMEMKIFNYNLIIMKKQFLYLNKLKTTNSMVILALGYFLSLNKKICSKS